MCGKGAEDDEVGRVLARLREHDAADREAKRMRLEKTRAREVASMNEKARLAKEKARLFEEKVTLRLAMERTQRDQECLDAVRHFDQQDFDSAKVGYATATKNRWVAFARLLTCSGALSPEREQSLMHDFHAWDNEGRNHILIVNSAAWAGKFLKVMKWVAARLEDKAGVAAWWEDQLDRKVAPPALTVPAAIAARK